MINNEGLLLQLMLDEFKSFARETFCNSYAHFSRPLIALLFIIFFF